MSDRPSPARKINIPNIFHTKLILKNSTTIKEKMERLLKEEAIEVKVNSETIIVGIEKNEDNIWGLLVRNRIFKSSRNYKYCRRQIFSKNTKLWNKNIISKYNKRLVLK